MQSTEKTSREQKMYCSDPQCLYCIELRQLYEHLRKSNEVLAKFNWKSSVDGRDGSPPPRSTNTMEHALDPTAYYTADGHH
jgi:hypothetical protein